jgi:hypothetical protein
MDDIDWPTVWEATKVFLEIVGAFLAVAALAWGMTLLGTRRKDD